MSFNDAAGFDADDPLRPPQSFPTPFDLNRTTRLSSHNGQPYDDLYKCQYQQQQRQQHEEQLRYSQDQLNQRSDDEFRDQLQDDFHVQTCCDSNADQFCHDINGSIKLPEFDASSLFSQDLLSNSSMCSPASSKLLELRQGEELIFDKGSSDISELEEISTPSFDVVKHESDVSDFMTCTTAVSIRGNSSNANNSNNRHPINHSGAAIFEFDKEISDIIDSQMMDDDFYVKPIDFQQHTMYDDAHGVIHPQLFEDSMNLASTNMLTATEATTANNEFMHDSCDDDNTVHTLLTTAANNNGINTITKNNNNNSNTFSVTNQPLYKINLSVETLLSYSIAVNARRGFLNIQDHRWLPHDNIRRSHAGDGYVPVYLRPHESQNPALFIAVLRDGDNVVLPHAVASLSCSTGLDADNSSTLLSSSTANSSEDVELDLKSFSSSLSSATSSSPPLYLSSSPSSAPSSSFSSSGASASSASGSARGKKKKPFLKSWDPKEVYYPLGYIPFSKWLHMSELKPEQQYHFDGMAFMTGPHQHASRHSAASAGNNNGIFSTIEEGIIPERQTEQDVRFNKYDSFYCRHNQKIGARECYCGVCESWHKRDQCNWLHHMKSAHGIRSCTKQRYALPHIMAERPDKKSGLGSFIGFCDHCQSWKNVTNPTAINNYSSWFLHQASHDVERNRHEGRSGKKRSKKETLELQNLIRNHENKQRAITKAAIRAIMEEDIRLNGDQYQFKTFFFTNSDNYQDTQCSQDIDGGT